MYHSAVLKVLGKKFCIGTDKKVEEINRKYS
jgi:hypothetical protein